jgi:hypothetical protein
MSYNQWSEYRHRRNLAAACVLSAPLFVGLAIWLERGFPAIEALPHVPLFVWFIGSAITSWRITEFRCPRCGKKFFLGDYYHNGFTRKCLHCRLPKWEQYQPSEEES